MQCATTLLTRNQFAQSFGTPIFKKHLVFGVLLNQTIYNKEITYNTFLLIRHHKRCHSIHSDASSLLFLIGSKYENVFTEVISQGQCCGSCIDANVLTNKRNRTIVVTLNNSLFILIQIEKWRTTEVMFAITRNIQSLSLSSFDGISQFFIVSIECLHLTL